MKGGPIDYIPESERHGHPPLASSPFGLARNPQITAIVTGALAVVLGGDVVWSLVGLLVGQMLGAAVMSLHALQGPRLGLPQMILSRAQFGVLARWCRWCWFASCISVFCQRHRIGRAGNGQTTEYQPRSRDADIQCDYYRYRRPRL
ncbi:cytosine permease [Klebsiella pneumoniae]